MSKKLKSSLVGALVVVILVGVAIIVGIGGSAPTVEADDAYRTTSLANSGGNIIAMMQSTDTSDERWVITLYFTPSGGSEEQHVSSESTRTDGLTSSTWWRLEAGTGQFVSGDNIRAHFQTYSSGGTQLFSYSRNLTIP